MKNVTLLIIVLISLLFAVDPWTGTLGPVHWWVNDDLNFSITGERVFQGIDVLNDSLVWIVGYGGGYSKVYKRNGGIFSHNWSQVTGLPSYYHLNDIYFI